MDWVNFREIRARVSIERVLTEYYKIDNLKRSGTVATGPCPVHGGNNPRGFHVDLDKNLWHCFTGCKRGGNQLDLVAAKDKVTVREAALRLKRFFLDDNNPPPSAAAVVAPPGPSPTRPPDAASNKPEQGRRREPPINPPLSLSLQLLPDHPHILEDRQLSLETAQHFGIGYCARGILAGCIGIPIHDDTGQLVAFAGRRLKFSDTEEHGKYRFPKGFHKDRVVYNLHRALPHAGEHLVLVEGFFSVIKLFETGIHSAAAVMGSDLSEHQAALAARSPHVILLFDGNDAGRKGAEVAAIKLAALTRVTTIDLPDDWEPETCPPELLRSVVADALAFNLASLSFRPRVNPVH